MKNIQFKTKNKYTLFVIEYIPSYKVNNNTFISLERYKIRPVFLNTEYILVFNETKNSNLVDIKSQLRQKVNINQSIISELENIEKEIKNSLPLAFAKISKAKKLHESYLITSGDSENVNILRTLALKLKEQVDKKVMTDLDALQMILSKSANLSYDVSTDVNNMTDLDLWDYTFIQYTDSVFAGLSDTGRDKMKSYPTFHTFPRANYEPIYFGDTGWNKSYQDHTFSQTRHFYLYVKYAYFLSFFHSHSVNIFHESPLDKDSKASEKSWQDKNVGKLAARLGEKLKYKIITPNDLTYMIRSLLEPPYVEGINNYNIKIDSGY